MQIIPLFVAIPLGAAFLMPILGKVSRRIPDILGNLVNLSLLALSLFAISYSPYRGLVYKVGGWGLIDRIPVGIYMVLDGLSVLMLIVINLVGLLATIYSINYMEKYTDKTRYYTLFLLLMAGMNGVVLSGDMFNIFVFLEISAIASYGLVAFGTEAEELEAAFKYQVMGMVASCFILLGIALLYSLTGTLNMADMGGIIDGRIVSSTTAMQKGIYTGHMTLVGGMWIPTVVLFVTALFIMGFGLKAAIMPFHAWLPDAHPSAPAPISAMLSGVLIKAIGVYALLRILFNVLGVGGLEKILYILMVLGTISMIAGALLALGQRDFKRLLAYSSVSQIGYIIFSVGLGSPLGFLGGLFHLFNHATFKSLLFLNAGAVVYSTDNRDLEKMGGLSRRMPVTASTSMIGSLSISGIPPLSGFWSKLIIIWAAVAAGHYIFAFLAVLVGIITLAYYLKLQRLAFFGNLSERWAKIKEVPALMCTSMIILAVICIGVGIIFWPIFETAISTPEKIPILGDAVEVLSKGITAEGSTVSP